MSKKKAFRKITKTLVAVALAIALSFSSVSTANAALMGIDVSKYNGAIDWGQVAASGTAFTFIKVGSTNSGIDPMFAANVAGAQAAGIRTGVYIYSYATSVEAAVNEANLVLQWIEGYNINYPVAFDIENSTQKGLDPGTVTAMCNAFCDVIAGAGYYPIVYTYTNFYKAHMTADLRYDKWIAQYAEACEIPGFSIWQSSSHGSVAGVPSRVDVNWMVKDYNSIIIPSGFIQRGDFTYFYENYRMRFGWVNYNEQRYHLDTAGHMNTGWFSDESGTYYLATDGHALVGQNPVGEDNFYFNETGCVIGGWVTIGENKFYYDPTNGCRMVKGWFNDSTGRHYLSPVDGHLVTGPQTIDEKNYYFNADGNMMTGMVTLGENTYYYDPTSGAQVTGFVGDIANRYYFSTADAHMLKGKQLIGEDTYYFEPTTGQMQLGWQTIDGVTYYFNPADGKMVKGWIRGTEATYYTSLEDGHKVVNTAATIDNLIYCFNEEGRLVAGTTYTVGTVTYTCDANGVATPPAPVVDPAAPAAPATPKK